jgi:hypothetical protein
VLLAWQLEKTKIVRLKQLDEKAESYNQRRLLKAVLKSWNQIMMQENRAKIKNNVLRKTEVELTRIQKEYEKIIEELERTLSAKLVELRREEEEHRLLHDKYEAMYSRRKLDHLGGAPGA